MTPLWLPRILRRTRMGCCDLWEILEDLVLFILFISIQYFQVELLGEIKPNPQETHTYNTTYICKSQQNIIKSTMKTKIYWQLALFTIFLSMGSALMVVYDLPLTGEVTVHDVSHTDLLQKVGPLLNATYLQKTDLPFQKKVSGICWGAGSPCFVNLPVKFSIGKCRMNINVIFRVDTGAPKTFLAKEVTQMLFKECPASVLWQPLLWHYRVLINHRESKVYESSDYNYTMNVLGSDYMQWNNIQLKIDYEDFNQRVQIIYDVVDDFEDEVDEIEAEDEVVVEVEVEDEL